jgi:hypothetical protein
MSAVNAAYIDGRIVLDTSPDWPNGTRLVVKVVPVVPVRMMTEDEQGDDPESITRWLVWFDSLEPLRLSPEDEARIAQVRAEDKAWELARWDEHSRKLESLFDGVTPDAVVTSPGRVAEGNQGVSATPATTETHP